MVIIDGMKEFFEGLARGFGLFLSERNGLAADAVAPGLVRKQR